jgi:predicted protein tyrosine phosphatase
MNEKERLEEIKKLEEEEATLIIVLHFHNINRHQTSFRSDLEREEHINDILDRVNEIHKRLKELKNDNY